MQTSTTLMKYFDLMKVQCETVIEYLYWIEFFHKKKKQLLGLTVLGVNQIIFELKWVKIIHEMSHSEPKANLNINLNILLVIIPSDTNFAEENTFGFCIRTDNAKSQASFPGCPSSRKFIHSFKILTL